MLEEDAEGPVAYLGEKGLIENMVFSKKKLTLLAVMVCLILPAAGFALSYTMSARSPSTPGKQVAAANPDELFDEESDPAQSGNEGDVNSLDGAEEGTDDSVGEDGETAGSSGDANGGSSTEAAPMTEVTADAKPASGGGGSETKSSYEILMSHYKEIGTHSELAGAAAVRFNADIARGKVKSSTTKLVNGLLGKILAGKQKLFKYGETADGSVKANHEQLMRLYELNEIRAFAIWQACLLSQNGDDFSERLAQGHDAKVEYDALYPKAAPKP